MSLSDLASLGTFVSACAVLISLVFLYFQIRQVTQQIRQAERNQRATIAQERAAHTVDVILRTTDPSMATAFRKAFGGADMSATELQQFAGFVRAYLVTNEDTFQQHRHGMLEDAAYSTYVGMIRANMSNPAFRAAWRMQRNIVSGEFAAFLDQLINETPLRPPVTPESFVAEWKQRWAEVTREQQ